MVKTATTGRIWMNLKFNWYLQWGNQLTFLSWWSSNIAFASAILFGRSQASILLIVSATQSSSSRKSAENLWFVKARLNFSLLVWDKDWRLLHLSCSSVNLARIGPLMSGYFWTSRRHSTSCSCKWMELIT